MNWLTMIVLNASLASMTLATAHSAMAQATERDDDTEGVSITVYSSADPAGFDPQFFISQMSQGYNRHYIWHVPGFGVIKDTRPLQLIEGINEVRFTDIAQYIDPTTVSLTDLTDPNGTVVLEQNYEFDLINPQKLYEKYIDHEVELQIEREGQTTVVRGTVLAVNGGQVIVETDAGVTLVNQNDGRLTLPPLPSHSLVTRPTLVWKLYAEEAGERLVRTTYQTSGITWRADYHLVLNASDTQADLGAWVTLMNLSGAAYEHAKLKLIAGDVQRVEPQSPFSGMGGGAGRRSGHDLAEGFDQKAFFEYHLYTLPRRTDILPNQTQQITLFPTARDVNVQKKYVYYGLPANFRWRTFADAQTDAHIGTQSDTTVDVYVQFDNAEANNLGIPLPRGKVRVYKADDADGTLEFVGEDLINHTPRDERLLIKVGKAFDIVGERTQTNFERPSMAEIVETFEIEVRNRKDEPADVIIRENLFRWLNWEIVGASAEFEKIDSRTVHWTVTVPPGETQTVTYTVRYWW